MVASKARPTPMRWQAGSTPITRQLGAALEMTLAQGYAHGLATQARHEARQLTGFANVLPHGNVDAKPLRQGSQHELADVSFGSAKPSHDRIGQRLYQSCRGGGMRHQAALRALAFKWIRILYRCQG
jgi:hypothetical protein